MWTFINIILIVIGVVLGIYASREDRSENYGVLLLYILAVIFLVIGIISSLIKWAWF